MITRCLPLPSPQASLVSAIQFLVPSSPQAYFSTCAAFSIDLDVHTTTSSRPGSPTLHLPAKHGCAADTSAPTVYFGWPCVDWYLPSRRSKSSLRLAREWRMRVESVMLLCGCARGVSRPGRREFTLGNKAAECSPATMGDAGTAEPVRIGNRGSDEQDPEQPSVVEERNKRDGRVGQRKQWRRSEWRTRGCSETR
ncbi:hypothetical protein C8F01DRAFT_690464 [Mycena amicta]|nr:hypothetical protein C8F01DRAFT_690464 [Mycena amicta]